MTLAENGQVELVGLRAYTADLPLRVPLHHSKVDTTFLRSVVIEVRTGHGSSGYAEVRANGVYATGEDERDIVAALARLRLPVAVADATEQLLGRSTLAAMLVDVAAWDALAREQDVPVASLWTEEDLPDTIRTHAQIGFGDGPTEALTAIAAGFDRLKVRAGADVEHDLRRLLEISAAVPGASLIVDANGAWSSEQARHFIQAAGDLPIAWLEQPTRDVASARGLREMAPWPLVADESARGPASIQELDGVFDGVHLKLEKAGTVSRLFATVRVARGAGLAVHLGQMDQGRLGCAVTTHLAAALGLQRAELWGCAHLADDLTHDLHLHDGTVALPRSPGSGVNITNHHLLKELDL